jgi:UDP-glucose 4-epimerase
MKILITGAAGFLARDLINLLQNKGHTVLGIDNFSKYLGINKADYCQIIEGDARDEQLIKKHLAGMDCFIPMAAMVGGIDYFHQKPFTIMAHNDALTISAFSSALHAYEKLSLKRFLLISSSMVFENSSDMQLLESALDKSAAPSSSYGFQKLNVEKYAEFAFKEFGLPCEVIRPFNAVGLGELQDVSTAWKKTKLNLPTGLHVIPDLILKCMLGDPVLQIYGSGEQVRCFTSSKDIANGIISILNRDFDQMRYYHLSSERPTPIKELAALVWSIVRHGETFKLEHLPPYKWDVNKRIPRTEETKELIHFNSRTELPEMIQEVYQCIKSECLK